MAMAMQRNLVDALMAASNAPGADLAPAALAIARLEYPHLDPAPYLERLTALGEAARLHVEREAAAGAVSPHSRIRALNTFLFESESSSETSSRGAYQDPDQLNTGENYTPGKRATSSYDNNLASWTMSGK